MSKNRKSYIRQLFDVYCREFKLVIHDPGILIFFIFLPIVYPVIYSLIYNPEVVRDVKMVVVDNDRSAKSRELVRNLDATQEAWVIGYAADMPEARKAMDSHKCFAILEIPDGFGRKIVRGEQANAMMYCEASLLLRYRGFLVASTNVSQAMGAEILSDKINGIAPLAETISTGDLMPIDNISMGNIENGFDSFIMPGVLILILHQCIVLAAGMAGGAKRERPSLIGYDGVNDQPSVAMTMLGHGIHVPGHRLGERVGIRALGGHFRSVPLPVGSHMATLCHGSVLEIRQQLHPRHVGSGGFHTDEHQRRILGASKS